MMTVTQRFSLPGSGLPYLGPARFRIAWFRAAWGPTARDRVEMTQLRRCVLGIVST